MPMSWGMIADFFKRLTAAEPQELPDEDARRALGALLVRVAKSDGRYAAEEIGRIDKILARRYDLNVVEAAKLRAECEAIETEAPDTVRFTKTIKEVVAYEEREAVIESLWDVVLADGIRAAEEEALVRLSTSFLGVSDKDSALARQRVEARMG